MAVSVDDGTCTPVRTQSETVKVDPQLETKLLLYLCNPATVLPVDSISLTQDLISKVKTNNNYCNLCLFCFCEVNKF